MRRSRQSLALPAFLLLGSFFALGALSGGLHFLSRAVDVWRLHRLGEGDVETLNVPLAVTGSVFVLWLLSLNAVVAGLVLGVLSVTRSGGRVLVRVVVLLLLGVGGVVGDLALSQWHTRGDDLYPAQGFVHDGRLQAVGETLFPLLVLAGLAYLLLRPRGVVSVPPAQVRVEPPQP